MHKIDKEIKIKVNELVGARDLYAQGGALVLSFPTKLVKRLNLDKGQGFAFLDTDKGILLVKVENLFRPDVLKDALAFLKLDNVSSEDLKALLEEDDESE